MWGFYMVTENLEKGTLQINVINEQNEPVSGARVQIFITGGTNAEIDDFTTDASGQSAVLELAAPPIELSLEKFNDTTRCSYGKPAHKDFI